ncbi:MAG: methylmalonyl-CoA mutase [Planctomycetes bacterium]|nr:methylmalonyl-CoA mutase [Planctomycetota bacterium]
MDPSQGRKVVTESGIEIKPVYTAADVAGLDPGRPGEFPFTRGIHPEMYRKQPWTMRQYAGFGTPEQTNERFRALIAHGQNALNVAFDLPTQLGLDSDDPRAEGEVGRVGMAVDTLDDMERAFEGIPLGKVSTALTINAPALVLLAMHLAAAEAQGVPAADVRGTLQNDILKEFIGRGAWIYPAAPSVRLVADSIEYCAKSAPRYNAVSVCGYHLRESGATPAEEMALAFGIARTYIEAATARGVAVDEVAGKITFNLNVFGNLWEQVAKFRAGRKRWAAIVRAYGAKEAKSAQLRMLAGGGGGGLTIEEPENNIVRGAYYALAAALGGAQTMALCCYDEAYSIPTEKASLLSLRTMQILAEEVGLCDTADPLGGSYFVEALTAEMEKRILEAEGELRALGGMVRAIEEGTIQRKLARQAYESEKRLRSGEAPKIGVNRHVVEGAPAPAMATHPYDPSWAEKKVKELKSLRARRSSDAVGAAVDAVKRAAAGTENLVPPILAAVKARATVGEICGALKEVFGEFREPRF